MLLDLLCYSTCCNTPCQNHCVRFAITSEHTLRPKGLFSNPIYQATNPYIKHTPLATNYDVRPNLRSSSPNSIRMTIGRPCGQT